MHIIYESSFLLAIMEIGILHHRDIYLILKKAINNLKNTEVDFAWS